MNLREFYITPAYLKRMEMRARSWTEAFITGQIDEFRVTIPDYPEVIELLEAELHRRRLNGLKTKVRRLAGNELVHFLESMQDLFRKGGISQDELEVVETEWKVRNRNQLSEVYKPGQTT